MANVSPLFGRKKKRGAEDHHDPGHNDHHGSEHAPVGHDDESNWLVSYADMMTLLCGFFIMLFSMAKLDDRKFEAAKESITTQFGGDYRPANAELGKFVTKIVHELGIEKEVNISIDPTGVVLVLESAVLFETLSADVRTEGRRILDQLAEATAARQVEEKRQFKVVIEGHTDGRPVLSGSFPSNWELSGARASSVVRLFQGKGFSPKNLVAIGYADTYPRAAERRPDGTWDEKALSQNRRVVIRIMDAAMESVPLPLTEAQKSAIKQLQEQRQAAAIAAPAGAPPVTPGAPAPGTAPGTAAVAAPVTPLTAAPTAPTAFAPPPTGIPVASAGANSTH